MHVRSPGAGGTGRRWRRRGRSRRLRRRSRPPATDGAGARPDRRPTSASVATRVASRRGRGLGARLSPPDSSWWSRVCRPLTGARGVAAVAPGPALRTAGHRHGGVRALLVADPGSVHDVPVRPVLAGELGQARVGRAADGAEVAGRVTRGGEACCLERRSPGRGRVRGAAHHHVAVERGRVDHDRHASGVGARAGPGAAGAGPRAPRAGRALRRPQRGHDGCGARCLFLSGPWADPVPRGPDGRPRGPRPVVLDGWSRSSYPGAPARRWSPTYGCGTAPDSDRLPLDCRTAATGWWPAHPSAPSRDRVPARRRAGSARARLAPGGRSARGGPGTAVGRQDVRVYTKTGDDGTTGRFLGGRVSKADVLVDASGDVDEAVAVLGLARAGCDDASSPSWCSPGSASCSWSVRTSPPTRTTATGWSRASRWSRRRWSGRSRGPDRPAGGRPAAAPGLRGTRLRPDVGTPGPRPDGGPARGAPGGRRAATGHVVGTDAVRYLNRLSDLLFVLARRAAGEVEPVSHE